MKYNETLVSVILPVCNAEHHLAACLDSLLRQTYQHIEIIAIDDDSRDGSYKILRSYAKNDRRLKLFRNKKRYGLGVCLNRAMKRARGKYVAFMNANDLSSLHRIKRQINFLTKNPGTVAVGSQQITLDWRSRRSARSSFPLIHEELYPTLVSGKKMQFESTIINKAKLPKDLLKFSNHPYPLIYSEVFIKMTQYGRVGNLDQHLYYKREVVLSRLRIKKAGIDRQLKVAQFWMKSVAVHDYRPSVRALVQPLLSPVKTIFE